MSDEHIDALEKAKWWAMTLPREQFEMVLAISNEASRRGEIAGIAEERARIVAWLNDRKAVSAFYIDHIEAGLAADCIEAGEHLK